jgi:hypothetical protein
MQSQTLLESISNNDDLAINTFKQYRLSIGLTCKKCGHDEHYWLSSKNQFQCKQCRFRTTIRSGSIMESCKLPLSYFFITMSLLINSNGKLTVEELQKATNHKYYEPIWSFLHKIKSYYKSDNITKEYSDFINTVLAAK